MGEWSEYFEDFPEENPANWIGGRFDPRAAADAREQQDKVRAAQARLDATIQRMIQDGKQRERANKRRA